MAKSQWGVEERTPIFGLGFIAFFEGLLIHDDDADAHDDGDDGD